MIARTTEKMTPGEEKDQTIRTAHKRAETPHKEALDKRYGVKTPSSPDPRETILMK